MSNNFSGVKNIVKKVNKFAIVLIQQKSISFRYFFFILLYFPFVQISPNKQYNMAVSLFKILNQIRIRKLILASCQIHKTVWNRANLQIRTHSFTKQQSNSNRMFSWLSRCCTSSNACQYQAALQTCTYADWSAPAQSSMEYVIECMQGRRQDIVRTQKAFLIFRTRFERHQQKNSTAFRLKNLLILDRCTQQMCILDLIANYEYNRLFYDRNKTDLSLQNKHLQQFVCAYYLYIRKKADIYQRFPDEVISHKTRKFYLTNANNLGRIFEFIDFALQIQRLLNEANDALKKVNKSPLLIQEILTYMLKTYILLYTIVAISLQTLLSKLKSLKHHQLSNLDRLLKYFSRDFSNTFLTFLQANKTIPAFKTIQYNEIVKIDQSYLAVFEKYFRLKVSEMAVGNQVGSEKTLVGTPTTAKSSLLDSQEFQTNLQELPEEVSAKLSELKFSYQPRHMIQQLPSSDDHIFEMNFIQHKNYYSQDFIKDNDIRVTADQSANQTTELKMTKSKSRVQKKKSMMEDLINSKTLKRKSMKEQLPPKRFREAQWNTWQNVYSED